MPLGVDRSSILFWFSSRGILSFRWCMFSLGLASLLYRKIPPYHHFLFGTISPTVLHYTNLTPWYKTFSSWCISSLPSSPRNIPLSHGTNPPFLKYVPPLHCTDPHLHGTTNPSSWYKTQYSRNNSPSPNKSWKIWTSGQHETLSPLHNTLLHISRPIVKWYMHMLTTQNFSIV